MKSWIRRIISVVLILALLASLQRLVQPKYATDLFEGSYTSDYYKETLGHQVMMVGDCELYENFDPITLWDKYGITSYIRGNAQQLTWQSYYLLKEALEKETPDVVIFNVLELKYDEPQKEEYNRLTLDNMKWSVNKVNAIRASMTEEESFFDYLFPILRYHARILQLTDEDFTYYASGQKHTIAGYYMRTDISPYALGEWGDENYVGAYTDRYLQSVTTETTESDEDDDWSAEADEEEDDDWSAEADEEEEDDWSAESDEEDDDWSAEADEEEDDDWSAEADEDEADDWSAEADEEEEDDWSAEADEDEDDDWSAEADEEEDDDDGPSELEEGDLEDASEDDALFMENLIDFEPANARTDIEPLGDNAMHYLDLIRELCEEKGVTLLLVKAPSVSPAWYDVWDEQIVAYAKQYQLDYLNYLPLIDEIGIDFATDTYDEGLHMNYAGAVKCADYLGRYLKEHYQLNDMRTDANTSFVWNQLSEEQKKVIEAQKEEIAKYGKVISY